MMREPPFSLLPRPAPAPLKDKRVLVLGLGDTGLSVARWVEHEGGKVRAADTRKAPPREKDFAGELHSGPFTAGLLDDVDLVCVSPGLSLKESVIQAALAKRIPVLGDIELFAWRNQSKVLAITGTNGKTTVTSLAGHLLKSAGFDCEVAGNIAPPVLQAALQRKSAPAAWVLELSSYQLETTWSLQPHAAAMLNLTEDHLDRYAGIDEYGAAKARIFAGAGLQVLNRDDPRSLAMMLPGRKTITFGLDADGDFGVRAGALICRGVPILRIDELQIPGAHNVANALAACALAGSLGASTSSLAMGLRSFKGLPHRVERVASRRGVEWYDDSKGTNVGATIAALCGLGKRTVLILGGEGKGQDFTPLAEPARKLVSCALLIGRDAPLIEQALTGIATERCSSLEEAVTRAASIAQPGEAVLLSPACASFDMFRDYKHRGEVFATAVRALPA
jgi:UDP-N-acetylmuramoylalanine--D-glutamate ligase